MTPMYADLGDLLEDERIALIGQLAESGNRIGFLADNHAMADRYLQKLTARFNVQLCGRGAGPVKGTIAVSVGPVTH